MKFANKECARCNRILPANEMLKVTERVSSGSTDRYSLRKGSYRPTGRTISYKDRTIFLCPECAEKRRVWQRRKLGLSAIAGAVLLLVSTLSGRPKNETQEGTTGEMNAPSAATSDLPTNPTSVSDALDNPREQVKPSAEPVGPTNLSTPDAKPTNSDHAMVEQVENWISLALSDDRDTEWSTGNIQGMIKVSDAPPSNGRTCRNFTVNVLENGVPRQIGNGTRCATMGNGGWVDE